MAQPSDNSTEFCLITGEGKGAIATIWVSGLGAHAAINRCFTRHSSVHSDEMEIGRVVYGNWLFLDTPVDARASELPVSSHHEDLIVVRIDNFTFEIHSHGGSQSWKWLCHSLLQIGLIQLSVEDYWTRNSKSWLKSLLLQTIPLATTERTSLFLLDQTMAWSTQSNVFRDYCIRKDHTGLLESIASIQKWKEFGIHLTRPWQVVIAGRPNVGKSSLINALAGFSRAIVHEHPGTTRDVISQRTAFDGWPVELRDTAGLRVGTSEIESLGIEKAWEVVRSADCRIAVFDASQRWTEADSKLVDEIQPQITAFNKVDQLCHDATRPNGMFISATQNNGVDELCREIAQVVVRHPPSRLQAVPFNERLDTWLDSLSQMVVDRNWEKVRHELDGLTTDGEL